MYPPLNSQLAMQREAEIRREAARYRGTAVTRQSRESMKERAGWALIRAGLKLTGPPVQRGSARPRPVGL
jgi:hypothetical protein